MATILIIDDDEGMRALMRELLERDGHQVADTPDGDRGLARFAAEPADLVVVDLFMPGKSGWETIRELQQLAPGLPFVLVSAGGALEVLRKGTPGTLVSLQGRVPYRYLRKPFSSRQFVAAVNELLRTPADLTKRTG